MTSLEAVFITHTDKDHIGGLNDLLENGDVSVGKVCAPAVGDFDEDGKDKVDKRAEKHGFAVTRLSVGEHFSVGKNGLFFDVLAPVRLAAAKTLDTVRYRGLNIIYDTKQHVRSEILRRTISLYPNALYSAQDVKRTYDNIMRLGYYKSASILFTEVADSTQKDNFISFVGTDSTGSDEADYTAEHYLSCECCP